MSSVDHGIRRIVFTSDRQNVPHEAGDWHCFLTMRDKIPQKVHEALSLVQGINQRAPERAARADLHKVKILTRFPETPEARTLNAEIRAALPAGLELEEAPLRHFKSFHHAHCALNGIHPQTVDALDAQPPADLENPRRLNEVLVTNNLDELLAYVQLHPNTTRDIVLVVGDMPATAIAAHIHDKVAVELLHAMKENRAPEKIRITTALDNSEHGHRLSRHIEQDVPTFLKDVTIDHERPTVGRTWSEQVRRTERDFIREQTSLAREAGIEVARRREHALSL